MIGPPSERDDLLPPSALQADYLLGAPSAPDASSDHTTPVAELQPDGADYCIHAPDYFHGADYTLADDEADDYCLHSPTSTSSAPRSAAVGIPTPVKQTTDYLPMGPCHSLPTVQEKSSKFDKFTNSFSENFFQRFTSLFTHNRCFEIAHNFDNSFEYDLR